MNFPTHCPICKQPFAEGDMIRMLGGPEHIVHRVCLVAHALGLATDSPEGQLVITGFHVRELWNNHTVALA